MVFSDLSFSQGLQYQYVQYYRASATIRYSSGYNIQYSQHHLHNAVIPAGVVIRADDVSIDE